MRRLIGFVLLCTLCLGCSGSNIGTIIGGNVASTRAHAGFLAVLGAVSWLAWRRARRGVAFPAAFLAFLVLHPAWWGNAASGDCGFGMADGAFGLSVTGAALLAAQLLCLARPRTRRAVLGALAALTAAPLLLLALRPDPVQPGAEAALLDAAATGNLSAVEALLARGAAVDARRRSNPPSRWELLHNAWTALRHPGYPFQKGYTPLMLACIGGHRAVAGRLLRAGADPDAEESAGGSTARTLAAEYGHEDLIPLLTQHPPAQSGPWWIAHPLSAGVSGTRTSRGQRSCARSGSWTVGTPR